MTLTPANGNEERTPQMETVEKEQQLTEENTSFFQSLNVTEGAESLLRKVTQMDHLVDIPDNKDTFPGNPQADFLHKVDKKHWERWPQEAEPGQSLWNEQGEQDGNLDDRHMSPSLPVLERNTPELSLDSAFCRLNFWNAKMGLQAKELGADHLGWVEKVDNIMQKINRTESTLESLLNEVTSLEDQSENLEDENQGENIEAKIVEIKKQLKEMNNKLAQVDACDEAQRLKEKLTERIENFYKEMNLLNTKLGVYRLEEEETESPSSEDTDVQETEPLLLETSAPSPGPSAPLRSPVWKHVLKAFIVVYVVTFTGLSWYILFVDATLVFERVLPSMLGHHTMWEFREMMAPYLNLDVEDVLPS